MTQSIFDEHAFLQSLAGDRELAEELLGAFMDDSPERSKSLNDALEEGDGSSVARFAHSLKGMCGVVRAESLVALALSMENAAKGGDLAQAKVLYTDFKGKLDTVHDEMNAFIGN